MYCAQARLSESCSAGYATTITRELYTVQEFFPFEGSFKQCVLRFQTMNVVIGLPAVLKVEENCLKYSEVGDTLWVAVFRGKGVDRTPYLRHMSFEID
jgi:hypothetical protein